MIINSPYLPATKSAGGLTFAKWKGFNTARGRIFANSSRSPKQIFQRARFAYVQQLATLWGKSAIARFWKQWEKNTTANNELMRLSVPLQPVYVDDTTPFDPEGDKFRIMKGDLEMVAFDGNAVYTPATGKVVIPWTTPINGNGLASDKIYLLVLDGHTPMAGVNDTHIRSDGTGEVQVGKNTAGTMITAYIGVYRELIDGSIQTSNAVGKDTVNV